MIPAVFRFPCPPGLGDWPRVPVRGRRVPLNDRQPNENPHSLPVVGATSRTAPVPSSCALRPLPAFQAPRPVSTWCFIVCILPPGPVALTDFKCYVLIVFLGVLFLLPGPLPEGRWAAQPQEAPPPPPEWNPGWRRPASPLAPPEGAHVPTDPCRVGLA